MESILEAVIFIGIQGSGKSSFYRQRFIDTHIRINMDMLKTRHREKLFLEACLQSKQAFVVDNTNPAPEDRARYIAPAREAGFKVVGFYFSSRIEECKVRNQGRPPGQSVPLAGLLGTHARLRVPERAEGFDELFYVRIDPDGVFQIEAWSDEVR